MTQTLLIIDDDARLIDLLTEYFQENGFRVSALMEGTHASKAVRESEPDLIILDIMLPGKDGLEVLKELRGEFSTPVIMLTARGDDTDRIVGLELGADDYLPKPFNPRELLARIRAHLRQHEQSEDATFSIGPYTFRPSAKLLLDENLSRRVFGQHEAVSKLANQVRVARAGLRPGPKTVLGHHK